MLIAKVTSSAVYDQNGDQLTSGGIINFKTLSATKDKKYNGIGVVSPDEDENLWECTAFFLDSQAFIRSPRTLSLKNSPAYALTNGHCSDTLSFPGIDELIVYQPHNQFFIVNWFSDVEAKHRLKIPIKRVVYTTTTGTDIAILELDTTYQKLIADGFQPLIIDPNLPGMGEPVEMIGAVWDRFLHRTICQTGKSVNLLEGGYRWTGSIRHHCSAIKGMSGSPLISLRTHRVIAIHNTSINPKALTEPECSDNRPCEVLADGKTATFISENYAQRVNDLFTCFDDKGIFNLYLSSCELLVDKWRISKLGVLALVIIILALAIFIRTKITKKKGARWTQLFSP